MSSQYPSGGIDTYLNPLYTKINGVDYVKAEHVNDLQDSVKNVQITIIGSGLSLGFTPNNYVPADANIVEAVGILDAAIKAREDALTNHLSYSILTDPVQHHSNVIEVSPVGNLTSGRLQPALEEIQGDINNIMIGGSVNSLTLDNRYAQLGEATTFADTLTVQGIFTTNGNTVLGSGLSDTVGISGDATIAGDLGVSGVSTFGDDLIVSDVSKIAASSNQAYAYIGFSADATTISSLKDVIIKLDSDDPIDGVPHEGQLQVLNGSAATILSLTEEGVLTSLSSMSSAEMSASSFLEVGTTSKTKLEQDTISIDGSSILLSLDPTGAVSGENFRITKDGDSGTTDTSTNILLKVKEEEYIAGNHILRRQVQETGYLGIKFYSDNAGGRFHGQGVNFKSTMINTPSSITLTVDAGGSSNYSNLSITDINEFGFFYEVDSVAVGNTEFKGTYATVGN